MPTIFDLVWYGDTTLQLKYYEEVVCAPFGRWVGEYKFYGAKLSVFHCGAKLSVFTWRCQIVRFYMTVPNCPRCQIVRFTWRCQIVRVPNCPFLHCGAKLSVFHCGAKLSAVPNCPWCQIVLESNDILRSFAVMRMAHDDILYVHGQCEYQGEQYFWIGKIPPRPGH